MLAHNLTACVVRVGCLCLCRVQCPVLVCAHVASPWASVPSAERLLCNSSSAIPQKQYARSESQARRSGRCKSSGISVHQELVCRVSCNREDRPSNIRHTFAKVRQVAVPVINLWCEAAQSTHNLRRENRVPNFRRPKPDILGKPQAVLTAPIWCAELASDATRP